ncbi:MAG TPA: DUF1501 domain-containing protein [Myxococcales bacterium]
MDATRRRFLTRTLFGAGMLGLRSLATGIPLSILANPRRALAAGTTACSPSAAQYILFSSSSSGDPVNANVPGTYLIPDISHPPDPAMAPTQLTLLGKQHTAAAPWARLPQAMLDRTCFFHHGTYTVVHPDLGDVMTLQGLVFQRDMLVSLIAAQLAGCLGTVQREPLALGPRDASEALTAQGRPQPILSPAALAGLLASPAGPLGQIQKIRDADLDRLNAWYKQNGNSAQRAFLDRYAISQQQARNISASLLGTLAAIKDNSPDSQVAAAVVLFRMNVSPVVSIHIPFGGDNHTDTLLANETKQTVAGVATIGNLWTQLNAVGLQDKVTFAMMNVFGRTLSTKAGTTNGRDHHGNHHVTVMIGKPLLGGVVGGLEPYKNDYRAMSLDSQSGAGIPAGAGDIPFSETLASVGKTLGAASGVDRTFLDQNIRTGKPVAAALAPVV